MNNTKPKLCKLSLLNAAIHAKIDMNSISSHSYHLQRGFKTFEKYCIFNISFLWYYEHIYKASTACMLIFSSEV